MCAYRTPQTAALRGVKDMDCSLDNLLTLAEDFVGWGDDGQVKIQKVVVEIPSEDRGAKCPIRLRVDPSPELLGQFPARQ